MCDTLGPVSVEAPEAGWYPIDITYFQRYKSSCLWLSWAQPGGGMEEDAVLPEFFGSLRGAISPHPGTRYMK